MVSWRVCSREIGTVRRACFRKDSAGGIGPYLGTLLVLFAVWQLVCPQTFAAEGVSKPNIVVILLDDLGYGDLGSFNSKSKIPTPHMDSLSREGMRFTDAHAPGPLCHMSRYGLLTGRYPFRTDVSVWPRRPLIEPDQMTIASLAKSQGYGTAMVGKWHLGFKEDGYDKPLPGGPIDCGFQSYFGIRTQPTSRHISIFVVTESFNRHLIGSRPIAARAGHLFREHSGEPATSLPT